MISLLAYWIVTWAMTKAPLALVSAVRESSMVFAGDCQEFCALSFVGTKCTHTHDKRRFAADAFHGSLDGTLPLLPREVSIAARASEQPGGVCSRVVNALEKTSQCLGVDMPFRIGWREGERRQATKQSHHLSFRNYIRESSIRSPANAKKIASRLSIQRRQRRYRATIGGVEKTMA